MPDAHDLPYGGPGLPRVARWLADTNRRPGRITGGMTMPVDPGLADALEGVASLPVRLPFLAALDWLGSAPGREIVGRSGIAYRIIDGALAAEAPMGWPAGPPLTLTDLRGSWELREG